MEKEISMAIKHLEVILKLTARCNINCTYCYYFYGADRTWEQRPKKLTSETLQDIIVFLKNSVQTQKIPSLQIDFHGGEPLLFGKNALDVLCQQLKFELDAHTRLSFALQTNAILIDPEWIDLIEKYQIHTSISLDGPEQTHNLYRVDHKGKGTYARVVKGLHLLQTAEKEKRIPKLNNLAVINPKTSGQKTYRHLVDVLEINQMDFLLPGFDYDTYQSSDTPLFGDYLIDVFHEWIKDDNPNIKIRLFGAFIAKLYGNPTFMFPDKNYLNRESIALTIDTDGMMFGDDSLRSNQAWNQYKALSIKDHHLEDFIQNEARWFENNVSTPPACQNCEWVSVCGGGQLENQYSSLNGYQNPSIYCEALQRLYQKIVVYLIDNGINLETLTQVTAA